ncbi:DegT/DnrJ/EryC1/StrS family aminotransferase [Candidatus Pelagibacter sp.]|nr:DegT/DnrJ/EryC1/StrS family aminotransferase [Candidatus Pelagibacter sp.]
MKKIKFVDLALENKLILKKIQRFLKTNIEKSNFILGRDIDIFEKNFAKLNKSKYCVTTSSGTSALILSLKSLNLSKGSEVLTVSNSYLSTVSSIISANLKPVLVDIDQNLNMSIEDLKKKITKKTKVILPVHLCGRSANIIEISKLAKRKNLHIIEDCAQAVLTKFRNKNVGNFGKTGCFSFHPLKNLGGIGDGGAIVTNSKKTYQWLKMARNNGHPNRDECNFWSSNYRMDTFKAMVLNEKIKDVKKNVNKRIANAEFYYKRLKKIDNINLPELNDKDYFSTFYQFIVLANKRNQLIKFLKTKGIETKIHYPKPIHLQRIGLNYFKNEKLKKTEFFSKKIISLPIHQNLTKKDLSYISDQILLFYKKN